MTKKKTDYSWINIPPPKEIISTLANGAEFLDIGVVEGLLYKLDSHWGTENFKFQVFEIMSGPVVSGSLELVVTYGRRTRRMVGAATLPVDPALNLLDAYVNANFSATLKSECIKNSCKPIGAAFGQGLNDRTAFALGQKEQPKNSREKREAMFPEPDGSIQGSYNMHVETCNQAMMDTIKALYPGIKYTGTKKIREVNA